MFLEKITTAGFLVDKFVYEFILWSKTFPCSFDIKNNESNTVKYENHSHDDYRLPSKAAGKFTTIAGGKQDLFF